MAWTDVHPLHHQHRPGLAVRQEADQDARRSLVASAVVDDVTPASSRPSEVDRLIADLQSPDPIRRDASVARLRVLGARAFPRLARFIESSDSATARALAISALDGLENPHAVEIAFAALGASDVDTVVAALTVLRTWVPQESGTRLLEAITAIAVDRDRDARVRVAAMDALSDLPDDLVRPIREQAPPPEAAGPALDNPVAAREWMEAHGSRATLATLHDAIKSFRDVENRAETSGERSEWLRARGVAHRALAARGSRLALYDARETFSTAKGAAAPGIYRDDCGPWRRELPRATRARVVRDSRCRLASSVVRGGATNRDAVEAWRTPCRRERHSRELVGVYLGSRTTHQNPGSLFTCPPAAIASQTACRRRGFRRCIRHQGNRSNSGCGTRLPRDRGS